MKCDDTGTKTTGLYLWDAFYGAGQEHTRVVLVGQLDRRLPQAHRGRDAFQRSPQHPRFGGIILFKASRLRAHAEHINNATSVLM
jgi:hypothetical protein